MAAGMSVGELFVKLLFNADQTKLRDFVSSLGEVNVQSLAASVGLGGLLAVTTKLMTVSEENALRMRKFAAETGQSAQQMQQLTGAAAQFGIGGGEVIGTLKHLEDMVARMKFTGEYSPAWALLGVDPTAATNQLDLMDKIQAAILRLRPEVQRLALQQLGLSDSWLLMFKSGRPVSDTLRGLIHNTDAQTLAITQNLAAWEMVKYKWGVVLTDIAARLAPALEKLAGLIGGFIEFIDASPKAQAAIIALATALGTLTVALTLAGVASWASGFAPVVLAISAVTAAIVGLVTWLKQLAEIDPEQFKLLKSIGKWSPILGPAGMGFSLATNIADRMSGNQTTNNSSNSNVFNMSLGPIGAMDEIERRVRQAISDALADSGALSYGENH